MEGTIKMKESIFYNNKNFECSLKIEHIGARQYIILLYIIELSRNKSGRLVFCPQDVCSFYGYASDIYKTKKTCEKNFDNFTYLLNDNILHKIINVMYASNIQKGYKYDITNMLKEVV